jgi:spore germination cell wall hydrolase CwlJ-like protein
VLRPLPFRRGLVLVVLALVSAAGGCSRLRLTEEDCMTRAMYFESNRSSREGMLAVGTVVMNRKESGRYPRSVCGVVGQKKQFAPGVLRKSMGQGERLARRTAREVLRGARHGEVGRRAMFFHTAGYSYSYGNMHYVAIAGGNAFYEKRRNPTQSQADVARRGDRLAFDPPRRAAVREAALDARMNPGPPLRTMAASLPPEIASSTAPNVRPPAQADAPLSPDTVERALAGDGLY